MPNAHLVKVRMWRYSIRQRELPRCVDPRHTCHVSDSGDRDILAVPPFFCKHTQALTNVFAVDPAYVVVNSAAGEADPLARSLQWSRRVIGLKVLLLLAEQGAQRIAARIDHQVEMGQRLRLGLQREGWQILSDSPFPLVCFSHTCLKNDRERHDAVVDDLRRRNIAWITRLVLANDQHALRACVTHVDTNADDIDALVAGLAESTGNA
jgi:hypothetical protein